ncbi:MAG: hypothetical protein HOP30_10835 [Cyclobacteriaceae bacterium]|nr:hypothetical protein [Cyclobacteriaceae bacterium]
MKKLNFKSMLVIALMVTFIWACSKNELTVSSDSNLTDLAQASGQLASGSSFTISGSSSSALGSANSITGRGGKGGHGRGHILDGTNFITKDDTLLAIIDAESAGDFRGFRMHGGGGATITHYDANGDVVTLPEPSSSTKPEGCSFSGGQFPQMDSLLATIVKTVVDFGTGVTNKKGDNTITRSGSITIIRSGDSSLRTETITFNSYKVNGIQIEGTKTKTHSYDSSTGVRISNSSVSNGKITFTDGTITDWVSTKKRTSTVTLDSNNKPVSGTIVTEGNTSVTLTSGTVLFSNTITKPITDDISCGRERHSPVSGTASTIYKTDTVIIDFGDGSCSNKTITVSINGVVSTKTIGR